MTKSELKQLIRAQSARPDKSILRDARKIRREHFGDSVYLRGLIEISSHCKNDCLYCGLRRSNHKATRYRLEKDDVLACCESGYAAGLRTFVLQGGEDAFYTDAYLCDLIDAIKRRYPDCAVTLSLGERSRDSFRALKGAGADRYLLRHESANAAHYASLHPPEMRLETRKRCLYDLMELDFQTGAGFMVGTPGQTAEHLAEDLLFLCALEPHMVGIGPFIPHRDTPFAGYPPGALWQTLLMLALTRILLPTAMLPATTALGSLAPAGRELGLACGANVVMPNLSPAYVRPAYSLYNNKLSSGAEAVEGLHLLCKQLQDAGFTCDFSRGDHPAFLPTASQMQDANFLS